MDNFQKALLTAVYFANNGSPKAHNPIEKIVNHLPINIRNNSLLRKKVNKVMKSLRAEGLITSKTGRTKSWYITIEGIKLVRSWLQ
ncbi:MAG: hypothetical protein HeimC2_35530 [Candidatus Heimdallarchaeota archaeon LC_2]|nr:MAG: hypothetical protein HeimC2_35530 [Candidatus Heimdallarchaeota archaeon LC_2]